MSFLPIGTGEFLRRRAAEAGGVALFALAMALFVALVSFNPADPSFNHATAADPRNLLGRPGALLADALLHGFGWAALAPVLVLLGWGLRFLYKLPARRFGRRCLLTLIGMLLLSLAAAAAPVTDDLRLIAGPGGAIGALLLAWTGALLAPLPGAPPLAAAAYLSLVVGGVAVFFATGLDLSDWRRVAGSCRETAAGVGGALSALRRAFARRAEAAPTPRPRIVRDVATLADEEPEVEDAPRRARAKPVVEAKTQRVKAGRKQAEEDQGRLALGLPEETGGALGQLPSLELLHAPPPVADIEALNRVGLEQNAAMLKTVLDDFGVRGDIVKVRPGPVVTLYELEPAPGTKSSRVIGLADDIARSMSAVAARVAVVPGRNVIGIELPNHRREGVGLRELLASEAIERVGGVLTLALGKDIAGAPVLVDLARMPHLLIAGTTGSGKSVAINAMILSLLYRLTPEQCRLIMIDPKMLELSVYDGIPHLLAPVVTEPGKAVVALKWTVREMEERYRAMSQLGVRNITGYNQRLAEARRKGEQLVRRVQTGFDDDGKPILEDQPLNLDPLPLIVVVVDEMADLMLVAGKDIEAAVQRLSQMARAAGIHLIMATQRPSVDVITGTIKANFPTRISFQVTSKIDSRTILGEAGAEQLLGQGDMLFMAAGGRVTRVHGPFVSDAEVESVVRFLKSQGAPRYVEAVTETDEEPTAPRPGGEGGDDGADELYDEALAIVTQEGKASTSFVQRRLQIGYNRAARLIERMEEEGIVSKPDRVGRREVLIGER